MAKKGDKVYLRLTQELDGLCLSAAGDHARLPLIPADADASSGTSVACSFVKDNHDGSAIVTVSGKDALQLTVSWDDLDDSPFAAAKRGDTLPALGGPNAAANQADMDTIKRQLNGLMTMLAGLGLNPGAVLAAASASPAPAAAPAPAAPSALPPVPAAPPAPQVTAPAAS